MKNKKPKVVKEKIGQITIQKAGDRYLVCISGSPIKILKLFKQAESMANSLRKKYGRQMKKSYCKKK